MAAVHDIEIVNCIVARHVGGPDPFFAFDILDVAPCFGGRLGVYVEIRARIFKTYRAKVEIRGPEHDLHWEGPVEEFEADRPLIQLAATPIDLGPRATGSFSVDILIDDILMYSKGFTFEGEMDEEGEG
ncbi:MAG: hypothetical protein IT462_08630 [Planctomycetes bacterium]|nr:hypothetical protein [Planctomycetota bacterium]